MNVEPETFTLIFVRIYPDALTRFRIERADVPVAIRDDYKAILHFIYRRNEPTRFVCTGASDRMVAFSLSEESSRPLPASGVRNVLLEFLLEIGLCFEEEAFGLPRSDTVILGRVTGESFFRSLDQNETGLLSDYFDYVLQNAPDSSKPLKRTNEEAGDAMEEDVSDEHTRKRMRRTVHQ